MQLQPRALETLLVLVRRRGEVVFEAGIDGFGLAGQLCRRRQFSHRTSSCCAQESWEKPRRCEEYIQTLPKRGYRTWASVPVSHSKYPAGEQGNADSGSEIAAIDSSPASAVNAGAVPAMHSARWHGSQSWLVAVWPLLPMLAVLAFGIAAIVFWRIASAPPKVSGGICGLRV